MTITTDFHSTLDQVRHITKTLYSDRRLLQQLEARQKTLQKNVRKSSPTLLVSADHLLTMATPNPYSLLDDSPPASPDRAPSTHSPTDDHTILQTTTQDWFYPRDRRPRDTPQPTPKAPKPSPALIALQHAQDMRTMTTNLTDPIHHQLLAGTLRSSEGTRMFTRLKYHRKSRCAMSI